MIAIIDYDMGNLRSVAKAFEKVGAPARVRSDPGVIMDAFEHGADGIIIIGCLIDNCHYVSGNKKAQERVDALKKLFDVVGLDSRRLRTEWINASERTKFAKTVTEFVEEVRALGPLPLPKKVAKKPRSKEQTVAAVKQLIDDTGAFDCVECGTGRLDPLPSPIDPLVA